MATKKTDDKGTESVKDGYGVPKSPLIESEGAAGSAASAVLAQADRVLARADNSRAALAATEPQQQRQMRAAEDNPVTRQFAREIDVREDLDDQEYVVDMMAPNTNQVLIIERTAESDFREFAAGKPIKFTDGAGNEIIKFEGQLEYEKFMLQPVVIRIHATKDKNEAPLVFVGVNGDNRWLARNVNYRVPRKFVERLAQAQEMLFETKENKDPTVDNAMTTLRTSAASYEFSVMRDDHPKGRQWLRRMIREGT